MSLNLRKESQYYIDGECCNKNCLKGRGGSDVLHTHTQKNTAKRKNNKDMNFMALSIKCDSLALRTESREK